VVLNLTVIIRIKITVSFSKTSLTFFLVYFQQFLSEPLSGAPFAAFTIVFLFSLSVTSTKVCISFTFLGIIVDDDTLVPGIIIDDDTLVCTILSVS